MNNNKKLYIAFAILFCVSTSTLFGQENEANKWAVQLNFQHQDDLIDLNFGQLAVAHDVKIRPHYSLELQRFVNSKKPNRRWYGIAELGYYNNLYHDRWLALKLGVGSQRQIKKFFISSRVQGGLARTQGADVQYVYEDEKWVVSQTKRPPTTDLLMSPRIDVGYRVANHDDNPIDVVLNYQMTLYLSPALGLGIPYHGYGFGVRYGF